MRLNDSTEVRRYMVALLARVETGNMDIRTAGALSNIAYKILMTISCEQKEKEIRQMEALTEEMRQLRRKGN